MEEKMNEQLSIVQQLSEQATSLVWEKGPDLLLAIVTLIVGLWVIGLLTRAFKRAFEKRNWDPSLIPFLITLTNITLKAMLFISVVGMLGVQMTSFVAILGAAGLAIGLSLQGTLQNFAGGVMILIFKPFRAGDFLDAAGYMGTVKEIQIFNTLLLTPDNKKIIVPNGLLSGASMTNFSAEATRRVDWTFGIAYGDDYDKAKEVLLKYAGEDERIHADPEPFVALSELADSSVNLVLRVWVNTADYWGVFFDMNEKVYKGFAKEGLSIPFPQMDVHVQKQ